MIRLIFLIVLGAGIVIGVQYHEPLIEFFGEEKFEQLSDVIAPIKAFAHDMIAEFKEL